MTATYDLSSVTDLNRVRFHTGDTNVSAARWTDAEITYAVSAAGSWQGAVILLLTSLQAKLASTPDYQADWLTESPSKAAASLDRLIKAKRRELGVSDVSATATHQWRPDTAQTEAPYSGVYPLTTGYSTTAGSSGGSGGGSGSVTSIAITVPAGLFIATGSPVTTDGTIAINLISQTANTLFAAPNGASGTPSFRALVAADLPDLSGTYAALSHSHAASAITSGTFDAARIPDLSATYALAGHLHAGVYAPASHAHAAGDVTSGLMALARGGTGADLSATGAGFLKQATTGAAVTVAALADTDIPSLDATKIGSGTFDVARIPWATATDIGGTSRPAIYAGAINMTGSITHNSGLLSLNAASGYQVQMYAGATLVADVSATAATFSEPLAVAVSSSDTNTVRTLATLSHATSGLAAAGLGVGINFDTETPTQITPTTIAKIEATFESDADELARISMSARYGTSLYEVFRVETTRYDLRNIGIGRFTISSYPAIAIGTAVSVSGRGIAIGRLANSSGTDAIAIGRESTASAADSVVIGSYVSATIVSSFVMSAAGGLWPNGISGAVSNAAMYARRGTGTNGAGSDVIIGAGASTGNAAGGSLRLQTAPAGASGSALNTLVDRLVIDTTGEIAIGAASGLNWGDITTDGTWRTMRSGNDLVFQRRESGSWVEKGRFTA